MIIVRVPTTLYSVSLCVYIFEYSTLDLDFELASVLTAISKNPSIKSLFLTRSFVGMKVKHIAGVMDALVAMIQKDDFPLSELVLSENKLKHDIHDFINALGSNQHLQKLGKFNSNHTDLDINLHFSNSH